MAIMGVASLTPAFPAMRAHFSLDASQVTLLITAFTLPGIFLAPAAGMLADRIGRKNILIPSLLLFGIAGAACFTAPNWHLFLLLRFLQGLGAASLGSLNVTLIGDLFSGKRRGEIMGYNAGVLSTGTAAFPAIGGFLANNSWQFPFLLPLLALPVALMAAIWLKTPEPENRVSFKTYLQNIWRHINKQNVWVLFTINILVFVILYGALLSYFPELLTKRFGCQPIDIGLFMSAFSVITALTSGMKKFFDRLLTAQNQLALGFGLYFFALLLIPASNNFTLLSLSIFLFGLGHGLLIPGIQTLLVGFAPLEERAAFMSINGMVLRIGQTAGPLIIGICYQLGNLNTVFHGAAAIAIIMLFLCVSLFQPSKNSNL